MTNEQSTQADQPDPSLSLDAVVDHFTSQIRGGRRPSIAAYESRYPQYQPDLHDLLSSVAMIEGLKQQVADTPLSDPHLDDAVRELSELGDYHLVRELGRGGMGIVFEGIHQSLGRRVAIKVLSRRLGNDTRAVERFRREAGAAAKLHHTHIVTVFGVGYSEGYHFYVMEFVDGWSVAQIISQLREAVHENSASHELPITKLDSGRPTQRESSTRHSLCSTDPAATLADPITSDAASSSASSINKEPASIVSTSARVPFWSTLNDPVKRICWSLQSIAGIADAIDYAYGQGILHRDLKPGNLLADLEGRVRLTDFGLVKHLDEPSITKTGDMVGTPQYMPPEVIQGQYDQRSEVYGLGLVLYEMLTLHQTFPDHSPSTWVQQVLGRTPPPLRSILPQASKDLERVVHKALARVPEDRYATAAQLRDDLRNLLEDRPISLRRPWVHEEISRWARRNPTTAILAGSCFGLLVLAVLSITIGYTTTQAALRDLNRKHQQLQWQQVQTEDARKLAVENEQNTTVEFQRAEANLRVSMEAMDAMFLQILSQGRTDIRANLSGTDSAKGILSEMSAGNSLVSLDWDGMNELAGVQTAITTSDAEFLKDMLKFYNQIAEQNSNSAELKLHSGRAYRRVGNSYHLIGEWAQAERAYRDAARIYRELMVESPENQAIVLTLAQVYNEHGQATRSRGDQGEAIRYHQRAIRLMQESALVNQPAIQLEIARTLILLCTADSGLVGSTPRVPPPPGENNFGRQPNRRPFLGGMGPRPGGRRNESVGQRQREWLQEAIRITDQLLETFPEDPQVRLVRAKSYRGLAVLLDPSVQAEEFRQLIFDAIGQLEELRLKYPADPQVAYSLALTYTIPLVLEDVAALEYLQKAGQIAQMLCSEYSQNIDFHQLQANIQVELAKLQFDQSADDDGMESLYAALASLSQLVQTAPSLSYYRLEHANVSLALAKKLQQKDNVRRAIGVIEKALEEARAAEAKAPLRGRNRTMELQQYQLLLELYTGINNRNEVLRVNREIRRLRSRNEQQGPPGPNGPPPGPPPRLPGQFGP